MPQPSTLPPPATVLAAFVELLIVAAAADHLETFDRWLAANHSIDGGEFAPEPEAPASVEAASEVFWLSPYAPDADGPWEMPS